MEDSTVAWFEVQLADSNPAETQDVIYIRKREHFYLGRNSDICKRHWSDPTISNQHVRIHCILYEEDPCEEDYYEHESDEKIPPLVYATDVSTNGTILKKSSQERVISMRQNSGSFLLDDGDELRISISVTLIYHPRHAVKEFKLPLIQQLEMKTFSSRYIVTGRLLGSGNFGKVFIAINQKTQRQLACKIIDVMRLPAHLRIPVGGSNQNMKRRPTAAGKCFREFTILRDLNHPNIISIEKVVYSTNSIYIFQDLVTGGDLYSYMDYKIKQRGQRGRLLEVEAAVIVRQILEGVEYLHEQDIVHRDLKPENILMTSLDDGGRIVITDFGQARFVPKEHNTSGDKKHQAQRMFSIVGTPGYAAPEVYGKNRAIIAKQGYSKSVDMWSIGSITVALLAGSDFEQCRQEIVSTLALQCNLSILNDQNHEIWGNVSYWPRDFITNLLALHEESRITATKALSHPWFSNKYYGDALDALYERSILDWKPRRKVFRLVECISESFLDPAINGLTGEELFQENISHYFPQSPQPIPTHDMQENLNFSLPHRENTQLSCITEENEEPNDFAQQPYTNNDFGGFPNSTRRSDSLGYSLGRQLTPDPAAAGTYLTNEIDNGKDSEDYGCGEFDGIMDEAWDELDQRSRTPEAEPELSLMSKT